MGHLATDATPLLPKIEKHLTDSEEQIRVYAARAVWSITGETERPAAILAEAARTGGSYTRYRALEFLASLETELERNQDAIATALNETDRARNKLLALKLLQKIPNLSDTSQAALSEAANHEHAEVRELAGRILEEQPNH